MSNMPHVLVLGAGVIGLTTAVKLLRRGARVTVVADRFAPNLTSVVAGALWEWPPAVCGFHHDQISLARSKGWCMESYRKFEILARTNPETGVFMRPVVFYFRKRVAESPRDLAKMNELKCNVLGFRHDAGMIAEAGINPAYGVVDAYSHLAPMIDTDAYMSWLWQEIEGFHCPVAQRKITTELSSCAAALCAEYRADVIVNCTGLGAKELGDNSVYPLRGALVRMLNGSLPFPLTTAHCVSHDETVDVQDFVFIVPRGRTHVVLGGLTEPDEWDTDIGLDNYQPVRTMYERCMEFMPALRTGTIDTSEPVRVGLRPFRPQYVRLEADSKLPIIHCYGHGGAGVTLSWGCAEEVSSMILGAAPTNGRTLSG